MDNQPRQRGFLTLDYLLAFSAVLPLIGIGCALFYYWEKTFRLMQAYYFIHENCRITQFILRKELITGKNWHTLSNGIAFEDTLTSHKKKYFLAKTNRKNLQDEFISSLYYTLDNQPATELIEGLEKIKIFYGIDLNQQGYVQFYTENPEGYQAHQIKLIQIFLLFTSKDNVLTHPTSYYFFNKRIQANNKRLHQSLHLIIALL